MTFPRIGCFKGTFKLQVRQVSQSYQASPRRLAYALQEPLKEEMYQLYKQLIIVLLDVDEISEWCKSFVLVPKANGKVQLCLDVARLNEVLFRHVHWDHTLNYILPGCQIPHAQ